MIDNVSGPIGRKKKNKKIYEFLFNYTASLLTSQNNLGKKCNYTYNDLMKKSYCHL